MTLRLSRFIPVPARSAEFLACLWQGPVPSDLVLHRWLYVEKEPRGMVILWEGGEPARDWVERAFGPFGELKTTTVTDATPGLSACLERDLEGFAAWLRGRGSSEEEVERQLDVRRRGMEASSQDAAAQAGRDWAAARPA